MKDVNILLSEILNESGATVIISNPETLSELQKRGLKLDRPVVSPQEFIDKLFESKKIIALESINEIPNFPDISIPTISLLYKEIIECVLFGLNGAAISLSSILVEFSLKQTIVRTKFGNGYRIEDWDIIEEMEFGSAITEARKLGILDNITEKKFRDFKNQIRNPYLHYNIKKLTKGVRAKKVKKLNIKTQEVEEVQLDTNKDIILWPHAKKFVDKKRLKSVLDFICYSVNLLFENKTKFRK